MTPELIERLRNITHNGTPRCVVEAADRIEALEAAIVQAREALEEEYTGSETQVTARLSAQTAIWQAMKELGYEPRPDAVKVIRAAVFDAVRQALTALDKQ